MSLAAMSLNTSSQLASYRHRRKSRRKLFRLFKKYVFVQQLNCDRLFVVLSCLGFRTAYAFRTDISFFELSWSSPFEDDVGTTWNAETCEHHRLPVPGLKGVRFCRCSSGRRSVLSARSLGVASCTVCAASRRAASLCTTDGDARQTMPHGVVL